MHFAYEIVVAVGKDAMVAVCKAKRIQNNQPIILIVQGLFFTTAQDRIKKEKPGS